MLFFHNAKSNLSSVLCRRESKDHVHSLQTMLACLSDSKITWQGRQDNNWVKKLQLKCQHVSQGFIFDLIVMCVFFPLQLYKINKGKMRLSFYICILTMFISAFKVFFSFAP